MLPRSSITLTISWIVRDRVLVLRDAHRPARDHRLRRGVVLGDAADRRLVDAGALDDLAPTASRSRDRATRRSCRSCRRGTADRARLRLAVQRLHRGLAGLRRLRRVDLEHGLADAEEERLVAADLDLDELARERDATGEQIERMLRMREPRQADFAQRIDADDRRAALRRLAQRRQHARVVRARVLADHEDQIAVLEVVRARRVPLSTPTTSSSALPLDSWHMFEQSGKLFVPNMRPSSW